MNKTLRKILKITGISLGVLFVLILLAAILIPIFYKDDIKAKIDSEIAKSVNADVNFDIDKFSLSILSNFPHVSATLDDFRVVNRAPFAGNTLISTKRFKITVDIWSVLFGNEIEIRRIFVDQPQVYAKVLADGRANWDIMIENPEDSLQAEEEVSEEGEGEFNLGIKGWELRNGRIVYDDASLESYLFLDKFSHKGSGNLKSSVFDLRTETSFDNIVVKQSGSTYLANKTLDADITMNMDLEHSKYTFKKNRIQINDFVFGFEGFVQLMDEALDLDMSFATQENEFKNILSLVPGMFTESFSDLKTKGSLQMSGKVKGKSSYDGRTLPSFALNLLVKDGFFQYPDLPAAVNDVQVDLNIENKDGDLNSTILDLKKLHLNFDKNPFDAQARVEGMDSPMIDASAQTQLKLESLIRLFPMEGFNMKGDFSLDVKAKGKLEGEKIPSIDARMALKNGFLKSNQYPDALEQLSVDAQVINSTGNYNDTKIRLNPFKMVLDGEPFEIQALFEDLNDLHFNMDIKGGIDLAKVLHVYPIEGMEMKGKVRADIKTDGRASYAMEGQYDRIPTSGTASLKAFEFKSNDLPQGMKISEAQASFNPRSLDLLKMDGFLGKSDIHLNGQLSNYIAYLFVPEAILKGKMNFRSDRFHTDEWMEDSSAGEAKPVETGSSGGESSPIPSTNTSLVVEVPKNIDFELQSSLKEVLYGKLKIKDMQGLIIIREGKIILNDLLFSTLGGKFRSNGSYDPTDLKKPKYSFGFGIDDLPMSNALDYMSGFSPMSSSLAKSISGQLSSLLKVSGNLDQNLMPILDESLNGNFSMNLIRGVAKDLPLLNKVSSMTNLKSLKTLVLEDLDINAIIEDGKVKYTPFNIRSQDLSMEVKGSNGLDGSLDFKVAMNIPKDKVGGLAGTALQVLGARSGDQNSLILDLLLGGSFLKPNVNIATASGQSVPAEIKDKVRDKIEDQKSEVKEDFSEKAEAIMESARVKAEQVRLAARQQSEQIKKEADEQEKKTIEEAAKKGILAKKAAEVAARKAKEITYKKADKLVEEADQKANDILAEAQKKADALE